MNGTEKRSPKENYAYFKALLAGTEAESKFDDGYAFAYVTDEKMFPDGTEFASFRTGYNTDQVISFTKKGDRIRVKTGYRHNYGNYECFALKDRILEVTNYGFGSSVKTEYDLEFNEIGRKSERDYGSCCD